MEVGGAACYVLKTVPNPVCAEDQPALVTGLLLLALLVG